MSEDKAQGRTSETATAIVTALDGLVLGQHEAACSLLAAYMAGGHALLEGVPGVGKTLLARSLAELLGLPFARLQFTPDLMPTDLIGMNVFDAASVSFRLVRGPVFTTLLMADEINRTPPKTQSALLEAMQECQVSIDGTAYPLDAAFFVVATQNPVEFEGTYPLPEAQLDRFLLRVQVPYPDGAAELEIYRQAVSGELQGSGRSKPPSALVTHAEARALRSAASQVHVAPGLLDYLARLSSSVRRSPHVELPVSPRGALGLLAAARSAAVLAGRDFATPDDVKRFLLPAWAHRIVLKAESELEGQTTAGILAEISRSVEVPR
jgi:MoxR-like ATPase